MNWDKLGKSFKILYSNLGFSLSAWYKFFWINFIRKNSYTSLKKLNLIIPTRYCVFDLDSSAKIIVKGIVRIGYTKVRGSSLETRIRLEKDSELLFNDRFTMFSGADIQVFEGGKLYFEGGLNAGCNIHCQIICADIIKIGRSTLIGRNVVIRDYDAHHILVSNYKIKSPISIGSHCWIGEGALISKGVTISDGSIVSARSWVIKNVSEKTLVGGSPAMPIQKNIEWKV